MKRDRVVLDTNVLISGALSTTSTPALALENVISNGQLLASTATLRELMEKLLSTKFDPYVSRERRDTLLLRLAPLVEIVEVVQTIRASRDPKDDKFLEVAVNGRADVIVTDDGDLLELNPFRNRDLEARRLHRSPVLIHGLTVRSLNERLLEAGCHD